MPSVISTMTKLEIDKRRNDDKKETKINENMSNNIDVDSISVIECNSSLIRIHFFFSFLKLKNEELIIHFYALCVD